MAVSIPHMRRKSAPAAVANSAPAPTNAPAPRSLVCPLGVVGYDTLELALLAALATGEPLLLVSDHGAAKSLLLVRLANALVLVLRHYNASILQFDDLIGFPIPDRDGAIRYAAPPGTIREAEVAFFAGIGRCRPGAASPQPREANYSAVLPRREEFAVEGAGDLMHKWPGYRARR
jgi:hypothetical protein